MTLYNSFVGVDIGKFSFVVAVYNQKQTKEYANDAVGILQVTRKVSSERRWLF